MANEKIFLALSTFPNVETARQISEQLVTENFVACANILPGVESIYRWEQKIETAHETLGFFKVSASHYQQFQDKLRSLHPYEVPEIISMQIDNGLPEYLRWVTENCAG